jgi:flavin-dependent dehydrogenase
MGGLAAGARLPPRGSSITVVGFGPAGAAAALAVHDAGAHVTVLERMPYGGGNALNSGGFLVDIDGPRAIDHVDSLCFGKTPRDVIEANVDGLHELPDWLASVGGSTRIVDFPPCWPHFSGHVTYRQFDGSLFACLQRVVQARGIEVRFNTRVTELPSGTVVLTAGGFEYDAQLRDAYLPLPLDAVGHPGNTGDAIRLSPPTCRAGRTARTCRAG